MMKSLVALGALALATAASAAPLTLEGDFIRVGISDFGTLGSNGGTSPGLIHDPTGTATFGINDYITPGTPHESFGFQADQFSFRVNDNTGTSSFGSGGPTLLTGAAAEGYDNAATWSGGLAGFLDITNSYFFNDGDERILIRTTVTALSDLTNLSFVRSVDPDPDVNTSGVFATNNQRGNSLFAKEDFVGAAGATTGLTLALINLNGTTLTRNTAIGSSCCSSMNPNDVLGGFGLGDSSTGDNSLNLAYLIGSLSTGSSITLTYGYAVGEKIEDTGGGGGGVVPEPATWAMMITGFGMVGAAMRRRRVARVAN